MNTERWRFEERKRLHEVARERHIDHDERPLPKWFGVRHRADGSEVDPTSRAAVVDALDLVVLHDSHTETARESFVVLGETGGSTHFLIDWDGQIYQTLDLALEANHVNITEIDRRSVSIDLVNPVDLESPPLPPEAKGSDARRPLSEFVVVQGEEIQRWGYTDAQMTSLEALLTAVRPRVLNVCRGVLPHLPDAEDACQDALLNIACPPRTGCRDRPWCRVTSWGQMPHPRALWDTSTSSRGRPTRAQASTGSGSSPFCADVAGLARAVLMPVAFDTTRGTTTIRPRWTGGSPRTPAHPS